MLHGCGVHGQWHRGTALGVGHQQRPRLADAIAPLRDVVAVQSTAGLVGRVLLHQLALTTHRLLPILPRVVQVAQVDGHTNQTAHYAGCRSLRKVEVAARAHGVGQPGKYHEHDDEQVVIGHLHVVGIDLEGRKDGRHNQSPQVFPSVGQHDARNQRRQIGQRPHLPDVASGNDNQEVGRERPDDAAQSRQVLTEVERTQQDVEAQQVDEQVPHIVGQPQVVGPHSLVQHLSAVVRRRNLVRRHSSEQGVRPTGHLARAVVVLRRLLTGTNACRRVVTEQYPPLDVGRKEIGKCQNDKQQHCQQVGQQLLEVTHKLHLFCFCVQSYTYFPKRQRKQRNKLASPKKCPEPHGPGHSSH